MMPAISFNRRTALKSAGAMAIAAAFAPLARRAPSTGTIMLVEQGNPLSAQFPMPGQYSVEIPAHDVDALKRIVISCLAQALPVAGLTSWASFVMVREIALDAGRTLAFEARHDFTGPMAHTRLRLGNLEQFRKTLWPNGAHPSFFDALFIRTTQRIEKRRYPRNATQFSWLLLDRTMERNTPTYRPGMIPAGAALPISTGMIKMKLSVDDRFQIQDLFSAYSWALDTGDAEAFVACFTPDAVVREEVFEDADNWEGHAGIRALALHFMGSPQFPGRQHHVTMPQFFPRDADHVDSRSFAFVSECKGEPPMTLLFAGYYEDEIVRHQGRWQFARRTIRLWDGEILRNFPGKGEYVPRKRPADLVVKRRSVPST